MPDWEQDLRARLARLRLTPTREAEIIEELSQHLDQRYEELRACGENEARRLALEELHDPDALDAEMRRLRQARMPATSERPMRLTSGLTTDIVRALRLHWRQLTTSAAIVVTLALGIGAGTSVFSVVNALFLRPLPYPNGERVRVIWEDGRARGANSNNNVSGANFLDWRERTTAFAELAAVRNITRTFTDLSRPYSPLFHAVTANFFTLLGNQPLLGRTFAPGEDSGPGAAVVILSFEAWQSLFAGDRGVIGKKVGLDGVAHEVIGVMPRGFLAVNSFATQPDAWIPLPIEAFRPERGVRRFLILGRLKDGVTTARAQEEMSRIAAELAAEFPATNDKWGAAVLTVREQLVGRAERPLTLIVVAGAALMLIAAFNVVCLLLAAGTARLKEMAARTALGASSAHVVRQLLVEAGLLAVAGASLGMLVSMPTTRYMVSLIPSSTNIAFLDTIRADLPVAAFAGACGLAVAVLCSLFTARQALRVSVVSEIARLSNRAITARLERHVRDGLVITQVALSVMLLLAAGLMVQTLRNLAAFRGFDAANLMTINVSVRGPKYQSAEARAGFFANVASRITGLPGVLSAGVASFVPPVSMFSAALFSVDDRDANLQSTPAALVAVQPGYFETMRIPVVAGRVNTAFDTAQSEPVVMISRELARRHFDGLDPLGRTLLVDTGVRKNRRVIVGIIDDVRSQSPDPRPQPVVYLPHEQAATPDMAFVVRLADGQPMPVAEIRNIIQAIDPTVPSFNPVMMEDVLTTADWLARFLAELLGVFTFVGVALVGTGVYGVLQFVVAMRQREFGVRMALGASFLQISRIVAGFAARVVAVGVAAGMLGFLMLGRLFESLLFGVSRTDSATFAGVMGIIVAVTTVVCISPLRQALGVSPLIVMKTD